jgi:hypothetical protein
LRTGIEVPAPLASEKSKFASSVPIPIRNHASVFVVRARIRVRQGGRLWRFLHVLLSMASSFVIRYLN